MQWQDWFVVKPCGLEPGSGSGWDPFRRDVEQYGLETAVHHASLLDRVWGAQATHRADLLAILAQDDFSEVRKLVAGNSYTPAEVLVVLSRDKHPYVREGVAFNSHTPIALLMALTQDERVSVRELAIQQFRQRYG